MAFGKFVSFGIVLVRPRYFWFPLTAPQGRTNKCKTKQELWKTRLLGFCFSVITSSGGLEKPSFVLFFRFQRPSIRDARQRQNRRWSNSCLPLSQRKAGVWQCGSGVLPWVVCPWRRWTCSCDWFCWWPEACVHPPDSERWSRTAADCSGTWPTRTGKIKKKQIGSLE